MYATYENATPLTKTSKSLLGRLYAVLEDLKEVVAKQEKRIRDGGHQKTSS